MHNQRDIIFINKNNYENFDFLIKEEPSLNTNFDKDNYSFIGNSFKSYVDDKSYIQDIDIQLDKKENNSIKFENKKIKFLTKKKKNPGRKPLSNKKNLKKHPKDESTNILKKILTHFITFLINFSNDTVKSQLNEKQTKVIFLNVSHKYKINIKLKANNTPKIQLKQIFDFPISLKNVGINPKKGKCNIDILSNKKEYEKIKELYPNLIEFFEQNILDIFRNYFFLDKTIIKNVVYFKDIKIILSPKTKTFYDFLQRKDNISMRNTIIKVVNKSYNCNL